MTSTFELDLYRVKGISLPSQNIYHLVRKLLTETRTNTYRRNCSAWTTKLIRNDRVVVRVFRTHIYIITLYMYIVHCTLH